MMVGENTCYLFEVTMNTLTQEQKNHFIREFEKIVDKCPMEIREAWAKNPQIIFVTDDNPLIPENIHFRFPARQKSEYNDLMNKLKLRKL